MKNMEFEKRLERAISRGQQTRTTRQQAETSRELTDEQLRGEHARCRLDLSEQIEAGLQKLADYFPGFRFETVVSEEGWGARISRDDIALGSRRGPGGA